MKPFARDTAEKPGHSGVMRAEWTDPDDVKPDARRTARTISGWRTYCPLRRMMGHRNSGITNQHVIAADMLREAADVAALGYSAERTMMFIAMSAQPRAGMSAADVARNAAQRDVLRAMRPFTIPQRHLLAGVVLGNETLNAWCKRLGDQTGDRVDPAVEKGKLLAILDVLAKYYDGEIREDQMHGRRMLS